MPAPRWRLTKVTPRRARSASAAEPFRVAAQHHQALLAAHQSDQLHRHLRAGTRGCRSGCIRRSPGRAGASRPGAPRRGAAPPARPGCPRWLRPAAARTSPGIGPAGPGSCRASRWQRWCARSRPGCGTGARCTGAPAARPCEPRGRIAMPSARTSEVITPAPRDSGAASRLSPTRPTTTRR